MLYRLASGPASLELLSVIRSMNDRTVLIAKILMLCAGCALLAAALIYVLKEWLGWL